MHRAAAERARLSPRHRVALYRDGLMIALLSSCSVRLRNLLGLTIGRHLTRRGDVYWVVTQREETKTKRPLEVPLPQALTAAIEEAEQDSPQNPWPAMIAVFDGEHLQACLDRADPR